jgi:c-di-GMP-related signal transduction protein
MLSEAKHPYRRDHLAEVGYELLFRDGVQDFFPLHDSDAASRRT